MRYFIALMMLLTTQAWAQNHSGSLWLYNKTQDDVIVGLNTTQVRPIASITKIMTAMVYLDRQQYLNTKIRLITPVSSNLPRQSYSRSDLLAAMLIRSDNAASETLAADYPGGREAFIRAMNAKARALGMRQTQFVDPSGLSRGNTSTVGDVSTMLLASALYEFIRRATTQKQASFEVYYDQKIRTIELPNTNRGLLFEFDNIVISKTGFTTPAGWCVGMVVEQGRDVYVVVVLGSSTKALRHTTARQIMINHIPDRAIVDLDLDWQVD